MTLNTINPVRTTIEENRNSQTPVIMRHPLLCYWSFFGVEKDFSLGIIAEILRFKDMQRIIVWLKIGAGR